MLTTGPITLVNGVGVQGDTRVTLIDLVAAGDLNSDGQDDLVALVEENYGAGKNIDMVAVLNKDGQPMEAAFESLGDGTSVDSMRIDQGRIIVDIRMPAAVVNDPCCSSSYSMVYQLSGQKLLTVAQSSRTAGGKIRSVEIDPSLPGVISSDNPAITGKITVPPIDGRLFYSVIDADGSEVATGQSVISSPSGNNFSIPVDLSWVAPGPLRIEIRDAYSTSHLYAVLAFASTMVDFEPTTRRLIPPPLFASIHMADEQNGWALSADRRSILHTNDGGQTWQKTVFAGETFLELYAINDSSAFVLGDLKGSADQNLYRTTDAGKTWIKLPTTFNQAALKFYNVQQGWAFANPVCGAGTCMFELYRTIDSGKTWQKMELSPLHHPGETLRPEQMVLPSGSGFSFIDPATIWLGGNAIISEKAIHLNVSRNAGKTWLQKEIVVPDGDKADMVISTSPVFITSQDGYILAQYSIPGKEKNSFLDLAVLMLTQDGGETWKASRLPVTDTLSLNVQMLSTENILIWNTDVVYKTIDAGQTWNIVAMDFSFPARLAALQFLSPLTGFALVNDHNPNAFSTTLYKTSDGGQTWQKVDVKIQP
jgi:photosystem II stability/assembly factor-like uncharacterized protein